MKLILVNSAKTVFALALLVGVAACGGGSGGGDGGGGGGGGGPTTYTVGGTVTGLSGTGLKIRNNTTDLTVTANGAFTFPVGLASAATYDVTVVAQPGTPTQVCTVANGSGTVGSSNITTVAITCTTSTTTVYTVSGTVSGLSGSGLKLLNNTTNVDITANGAFTFAVGLADAASYLVTVVTQPSAPTQVCTVANGSGTVSGANVTNVAITCTTPTTPVYTIGGTVTGLSGSGLTIRNNTTDLPIMANGAFKFGTPLASGAAYSVTVVTQPTAPAQVCTVANGSGTVASSNITDVPITCTLAITLRQWETPTLVGSGHGGPDPFGDHPQITFDKQGNAIAIWSEQDPNTHTYSIWWNQFSAASARWGTAAQLDAAAGGTEPQVAFDQNGNALAVWQQLVAGGAYSNILSSRLVAGAPWGPFVKVNTDSGSNAQHPQIALDAAGNAVAVWDQMDNIWSNRLLANGAWNTPVKVSTDNGSAALPKIALDAAGNALALWQQDSSVGVVHANLWASRCAAGGSWGTSVMVNIDDGKDATDPQIAFDVNGNALAVWSQFAADGSLSRFSNHANIWTGRLPAASAVDTTWAVLPLSANTSNGQIAQFPKIATDSSGNALAIWLQSDGTSVNVQATRYGANDGNWAGAEQIGGDGVATIDPPQVAFDASGEALAVWIQRSADASGTSKIGSNRYAAGSGWGTTPAVTGAGSVKLASVQIAFDANGNAMAVWENEDSNSTSNNVWSSRFDIPPAS